MLRCLVIFTFFSLGKSQDCSVINVSCADIKQNNGFKFLIHCLRLGQNGSMRREVEISENKTKIVHGPPFQCSHHVTSIDNTSITTRECRDLHVKCIVHGEKVMESCWNYVITENTTLKSLDPSPAPNLTDPPRGEPLVKESSWVDWLIWIIVIIVIISIIGIIVIVILCRRKKKVKKLCTELLVRLRLRTSQAGRETAGETGESLSVDDQQARDDNNQNGKLESVCTLSIDPVPRGETPPSSGLDRTLSNGSIQEPKNGDTRAPDVNRASNHRSMHRSMRDDPGGVNDKGRSLHGIREMHDRRTRGDRGPEDENGRQPLLQNQRAANADMTGGADLVYEGGFCTQQVRWSSTAPPDADVESTPLNMKNTTTDEQ